MADNHSANLVVLIINESIVKPILNRLLIIIGLGAKLIQKNISLATDVGEKPTVNNVLFISELGKRQIQIKYEDIISGTGRRNLAMGT